VAARRIDEPSVRAGWLGIAAVVVGLGAIAWVSRDRAQLHGERHPTGFKMTLGVVPFVAVAAWLIWLGANL